MLFNFDSTYVSREKTAHCPLEMSTNCQGAGFRARLHWESLREVYTYHHHDVICEIRNFVTDCRAVSVL